MPAEAAANGMHNLAQALRLERTAQAAIVGAGGKTTTLFRLANELGAPAWVAAAAHLGAWQVQLAGEHRILSEISQLDSLPDEIPPQISVLTGPLDPAKDRLLGLQPAILAQLARLARERKLPLLIEADGARRLPLKAPAEHEPPIPPTVDTVIVVAGLSGLGRPLDDKTVYGAGRFAALSGAIPGSRITLDDVVRVLISPAGGLKNVPAGARKIALLNQADTPMLREIAASAAGRLLTRFDAVAVAALQPPPDAARPDASIAVYEPAAAIVLAAGGSERMGSQKLLFPWGDTTVVHASVQAALASGAAQVIVVVGADAEAVTAVIADLPAQIVYNPDWSAGQGTSVAAGLAALRPHTGAAVFMLGDQPHIPPDLVDALLERHAHSHAAAVAPFAGGRRANPVLFDRVTFADLANLRGAAGGRQLLSNLTVEHLPWNDRAILDDLDTPEDYQRLKTITGS